MQPPPSAWSALESLTILDTEPASWRELTGEDFLGLKALCLEPSPPFADLHPCPRLCGCFHKVILRHDLTGAIGACRCKPPTCPDLELTIEDVTCLKVDRVKLGRALASALLLDWRYAEFQLPHTSQIGSWSSNAIPVILTIQWDPDDLRNVIAELALRLQHPFILLTPTARLHTAHARELLNHAHAALVTIESAVSLEADGTLQAKRPPAEIFAQFAPSLSSSIHHPPSTILAPRSTLHAPRSDAPRYALRKGLGVWQLIFDGHDAPLNHQRGIFYVAWALYHPHETPIHAIDLMCKVPEIYRQQLGLPELVDPATGKVAPLLSGARLQERSLALDDRETMRALHREQQELEAFLDSDDKRISQPEKDEALRDLEAIYAHQRHHGRRTQDSAQNAADSVRLAIRRFHRHLSAAVDMTGNPHPVLRPFAQHLKNHLLTPSARYFRHGAAPARARLAGCLTYEPPTGVSWAD